MAAYDAYTAAAGDQMVRVGPSTVCTGVGVFARTDLRNGTPVAAYGGSYRRSDARDTCVSLSKGNDYAYFCRDGWVIDGTPSSAVFHGTTGTCGGVAQLANDAIHPEVSGRRNNCMLRELVSGQRRTLVYLVTTRDVRAGEELLTSYGLNYWTSRARDETLRLGLPLRLRDWLGPHVAAEDAIQRVVSHAVLLQFVAGRQYTVYLLEQRGGQQLPCGCVHMRVEVAGPDEAVLCTDSPTS